MPTRRVMRGVPNGFLGTCASRHSDGRGPVDDPGRWTDEEE